MNNIPNTKMVGQENSLKLAKNNRLANKTWPYLIKSYSSDNSSKNEIRSI